LTLLNSFKYFERINYLVICMKYEIDLNISKQAELILEKTNIDKDELIKWFIEKRKIFIGGGDIVSFLEYKKDLEKNGE
jgi:hypothetical protein